MLLNFLLLVLVPSVFTFESKNQNWDLAVVINDQIELLLSNGSLVGSTLQEFTRLKALTFDNVRHQFIVSDMDETNDTIFTVQLTKETDIKPIIENLPDDIQGLAIDPIEDVLYWTDSINKTINFKSLRDSNYSGVFLSFEDQIPQDIVVDVCKRYIYWTNSNIKKPTIERARLDRGEREILVESDLSMPAGIAIDHRNERIYWTDLREGIYFRVESTNLQGQQREIVYEGTHSKPFGIAVDEHAIYWTDINNNALWKMHKFLKATPQKLRDFNEKPMGLVAKNIQIKNLPDCGILAEAVKNYTGPTVEHFEKLVNPPEDKDTCVNGDIVDNGCRCWKGYTGKNCEISLCYNYCVQGSCHLTSTGYPECRCPQGYGGRRCEKTCDGFCMNGGQCSFDPNGIRKCRCFSEFTGSRCEQTLIAEELCELICSERAGTLSSQKSVTCRCKEDLNRLTPLDYFSDPVFIGMLVAMFITVMLSLVLIGVIVYIRRRPTPRIKRRYIVNKNVTPLTLRPQPTEQCEITIENCCNMNVCETPCFEPSKLKGYQSKHDDKKKLLSNIENGDDLMY